MLAGCISIKKISRNGQTFELLRTVSGVCGREAENAGFTPAAVLLHQLRLRWELVGDQKLGSRAVPLVPSLFQVGTHIRFRVELVVRVPGLNFGALGGRELDADGAERARLDQDLSEVPRTSHAGTGGDAGDRAETYDEVVFRAGREPDVATFGVRALSNALDGARHAREVVVPSREETVNSDDRDQQSALGLRRRVREVDGRTLEFGIQNFSSGLCR